MSGTAQIGVTGLAVMGRNLARNFARNGFTVAVHNRTAARTRALVEEFGHEGTFVPAESPEEFVAALERPRRLIIMVKAGDPTDAVIEEFAPLLEEGDLIIDGGNAHFADTIRREKDLEARPPVYGGGHLGRGGGAQRADDHAWRQPRGVAARKDMFRSIAAQAPDGEPCCEWSAKAERATL